MSGAITSWYTRCSADDATRCTLCVRPMNPPRLIGTLSISSLLCSFIYVSAFKNRILKFAITNLREQAYRGNRKYKPTSQFHIMNLIIMKFIMLIGDRFTKVVIRLFAGRFWTRISQTNVSGAPLDCGADFLLAPVYSCCPFLLQSWSLKLSTFRDFNAMTNVSWVSNLFRSQSASF